jgi:hypothetical protein
MMASVTLSLCNVQADREIEMAQGEMEAVLKERRENNNLAHCK